ncbi:MAG: lmo0937 family membrane protein [Acidobacteriota bacterium]|nr:lmo0937 family membrane protein [Acidobacteriota bacterium]
MIWKILVTLLVLWLVGFIVNVGGSLLHLLLAAAAVAVVVKLVAGRKVI